jgi:mannose-6-phosphate isomerase-like protein (cupin superfamily)
MSASKGRLILLVALLIVIGQLGCKYLPGRRAKGVGLLPPPPPPEQTKYSDYQPDKPFVQIAPGVATRTVFATDENDQYHIEVQDMLIAPGQKATNIPLQGAAVFEVREGSGFMTAGDKRQDVGATSTFTLSEGEALNLENRGESHITLRMIVLKAK